MPETKSHYETLGIRPLADIEAIKRAYRQKIRESHPDRFAAEMAQLRKLGDQKAIQALERRIEQSKREASKVNEAYAVLSDPERRSLYDRMRSTQARPSYSSSPTPPSAARTRAYEQARRATEAKAPPTPPRQDKLPLGWIAGLFISLLVIFTFFSSFFSYDNDYVIASTETAFSRIPAGSVDATGTARANIPTATPISFEVNVSAADNLYTAGTYILAIERYSVALDQRPQSTEVLTKRGSALLALALESDAEMRLRFINSGLQDANAALELDNTIRDAFRLRGLLYYERWRLNEDPLDADAALADLETYVEEGGDERQTQVAFALVRLRDRES